MYEYKDDRQWADTYESQVISILNPLMPHLATLCVASDKVDRKQATDFEVKLTGGTVAVRLRRSYYSFRDLTIRAKRSNGAKTELAKIKEGYAYRYFYGWTDENNHIIDWILVDIDRLRTSGLLDDRPLKPNKDGQTFFITISLRELHNAGCLMKYHLPTLQRKVNKQPSLQDGIERARNANYYKGSL